MSTPFMTEGGAADAGFTVAALVGTVAGAVSGTAGSASWFDGDYASMLGVAGAAAGCAALLALDLYLITPVRGFLAARHHADRQPVATG